MTRLRSSILRALAALVALAAVVALSRAQPAAAAPLWETSRLASLMRDDMKQADGGALLHIATSIRARLVLTPLTHAVEQVSDLELALRMSVALQMRRLTPDFVADSDTLAAERDAAFLLHTLGHRYDTVEDFRFTIDGLTEDKSGEGRGLAEAIRMMRREGRAWFDAVVTELERLGPLDAPTLVQRGQVLRLSGDPVHGAALLSEGNAKAPRVESTRATCEALLESGRPDFRTQAEALREVFAKYGPAQAGLFAECFGTFEDGVATARFRERADPNAPVAEVVAQVERDLMASRYGPAEVLAKELRSRDPVAADRLLAVIYFTLERWESLRTLLVEAERAGRLDAHLASVRLAARVGLMSQVHLGAAPHPLLEGDLEAELKRTPGLVGQGANLLLLIAKRASVVGAEPVDAQEVAKAERAITDAVERLLKAEPRNPQALELALLAMAAIERMSEGLTRVEKLAAKLPVKVRNEFDALRLRVALGHGIREGDAKAIRAAVAAIDSKIKTLENQDESLRGALVVAAVTGEFAEGAIAKRMPDAAAVTTATARLKSLAWAFDTTTEAGRELEQARLLTLGTLAILEAGNDPLARFGEARSVKAGPLAQLAGGLTGLAIGDGVGAVELCRRVPRDQRPDIAQLVSACVGRGLLLLGEDARDAFRDVLAQWDATKLPADLEGRAVRALFTGVFNIGLSVSHDAPLTLKLVSRPILLLMPELVPSRALIEPLAR